jgi:hypothetical protein
VDGRDDEAGRVLEQLVEDPGEFADRVARE